MQELLEDLSNVYDVSVTAANASLWTVVFNDPVGDVPGLEVRTRPYSCEVNNQHKFRPCRI